MESKLIERERLAPSGPRPRVCPKCFEPASFSGTSARGFVIQCSKVKGHRYTGGLDVTYTAMRGTDGKRTEFVTYRAKVFKTRGKTVVDLANATPWAVTTHVDGVDGPEIRNAVGLYALQLKISERYAVSFAPAFQF